MLAIEFVVDKVPWLDSLWDTLHTVIRIPAGALLAASVFGGDHESWSIVAGLLGGTLAATSHMAKATTRAAVHTSPERFSNLALSLFRQPGATAKRGMRPTPQSLRMGHNRP